MLVLIILLDIDTSTNKIPCYQFNTGISPFYNGAQLTNSIIIFNAICLFVLSMIKVVAIH